MITLIITTCGKCYHKLEPFDDRSCDSDGVVAPQALRAIEAKKYYMGSATPKIKYEIKLLRYWVRFQKSNP